MTCDPLAYTGAGAYLGLFAIIAAACLIAGLALLLFRRTRGGGIAAVLTLILIVGVGVGVSLGPQSPAQAATSDCTASAENSLTVVQTSTMVGLAPGIAPVAITGRVTNDGSDSTEITAVDVAIVSVTTATGAAAGACDPSDYVLLDTRMPVGKTLAPGASTTFAGASIGFSNKVTNQDACQRATVHLLYTANPD